MLWAGVISCPSRAVFNTTAVSRHPYITFTQSIALYYHNRDLRHNVITKLELGDFANLSSLRTL